MAYHCQRSTTFGAIECECRRTMLPHQKIKFNLSFQTECSNYILINQDSSPQFLESLPPSNFTIVADVTAKDSLSCGDVREKLEEAIGDRLLDDERRCVIKRVWREVREILPGREELPLNTILYLDFKIRLAHSHVYVAEGGSDYPRMVPAADSSLAMLKKCDDGNGGCSICLEELHGAASMMMPCSHLFHGDCIEKWLRTSHFCPLCRYEMPTE